MASLGKLLDERLVDSIEILRRWPQTPKSSSAVHRIGSCAAWLVVDADAPRLEVCVSLRHSGHILEEVAATILASTSRHSFRSPGPLARLALVRNRQRVFPRLCRNGDFAAISKAQV